MDTPHRQSQGCQAGVRSLIRVLAGGWLNRESRSCFWPVVAGVSAEWRRRRNVYNRFLLQVRQGEKHESIFEVQRIK